MVARDVDGRRTRSIVAVDKGFKLRKQNSSVVSTPPSQIEPRDLLLITLRTRFLDYFAMDQIHEDLYIDMDPTLKLRTEQHAQI